MPIPKDPTKYQEWKDKISASLKGNIPWNKGRKDLPSSWNKDIPMTEEQKIKLRNNHITHHSEASKKKISLSLSQKKLTRSIETRNKMGARGENHWLWKGGTTPENNKIRHSIEYRLWREAVFARDNWTCQKYGIKGGKLHPHHIQNFSQYPELRFAIDNGITLSEKAHKEFHKKYGVRNNTREQLLEYLA